MEETSAKTENFGNSKWYNGILDDPDDCKTLSSDDVVRLKEAARQLLDNDAIHYQNKCKSGPKRSENDWLRTMMGKGTCQDRMAASIVLIQNSPLHSLSIIRNLVTAVKTSRKDCTRVMETLTDLFLSDLLPDRKLRTFERRPLSLLDKISSGNSVTRKAYLMRWYYEDVLKQEYQNFISAIQTVARDTVENNREKAIIAFQKLLAGNPEQEVVLLSSIVNKFGDPSHKVASKATYALTKVLKQHPNMKVVVMEEIEKLLFRANISPRAQYYGICFLSQYVLSREDGDLPVHLIKLYLAFFKSCIKKGDIDSRMMSVLLSGVNRAYPYAQKQLSQIQEHIETIYKLVHIAQFNVSLHALCLLFQVADYSSTISDRFYAALYKKISDPALTSSSHQAMFLSLVFRALLRDLQDNRIKVFIKRLLQVCNYVPPQLACGILFIVSHVMSKNSKLKSVKMIATDFSPPLPEKKLAPDGEEEEEEEEEKYTDVKCEDDESKPEILNTTTKDVESATEHNTTDDEIHIEHEVVNINNDDSEVKEENVKEENDKIKSPIKEEQDDKKLPLATWHHSVNLKALSGGHHSKGSPLQYNPFHRNPLFAGGHLCVYTELLSLATHFHPTVSLFASRLLHGEVINYSGDPLRDFTSTRFLERFVFKNPKKEAQEEKEPTKFSRKWKHTPSGLRGIPVTSEGYLNTDESQIPVEEVFLYRFLKKRQAQKEETTVKDEDGDDTSSVASEEFESMMDQILAGKETIDYSEEIQKLPPNKKGKGKKEDVNAEEEEDASGSDDASDGEIEEMDDDGLGELDDEDLDDEEIEFDGDDDIDGLDEDSNMEESMGNKNKRMQMIKGKRKANKGIDKDIFAPAEEFSQMLEETGDFNVKHRSLAALSNQDNAGVKQLKWETERNQRLQGPQWRKRKQGSNPSKKSNKRFKKR